MFQIKETTKGEAILEIHGPLSGDNTAEFQKQLTELSAGGHNTISLNLTDVSTINSSSLGKILLFRKKLSEEGRILQIKGCSEALYKTFLMIKFDKLISVTR
jgi:anti-anti-sigma factor